MTWLKRIIQLKMVKYILIEKKKLVNRLVEKHGVMITNLL